MVLLLVALLLLVARCRVNSAQPTRASGARNGGRVAGQVVQT